MTPKQLADLASAFDAEPSFEFLSPEGSAGFPVELHGLAVDDVKRMIAQSEAYAAEAKALSETEGGAPIEGSEHSPVAG
jgi:hypothetical protein